MYCTSQTRKNKERKTPRKKEKIHQTIAECHGVKTGQESPEKKKKRRHEELRAFEN